MGRVEAFRDWWPWLRRFDADALRVGDRWRCTIRPPLPYLLRLTIRIDEAVAPSRILATVSGDIDGHAAVHLEPDGSGCAIRLTSTLVPARQPLKAVAAVAPGLARFGHDWVLDTGFEQFSARSR